MAHHRKPLSRFFPAYHQKAGQPTYFVEKIMPELNPAVPRKQAMEQYFCDLNKGKLANGDVQRLADFTDTIKLDSEFTPKYHTIRQCAISKKTGKPLKVKAGDTLSFYVWDGKPYGKGSTQITVSNRIEVKKVWDFEIRTDEAGNNAYINNIQIDVQELIEVAANDGLSFTDLMLWFKHPKPTGPCQIICWSDEIEY